MLEQNSLKEFCIRAEALVLLISSGPSKWVALYIEKLFSGLPTKKIADCCIMPYLFHDDVKLFLYFGFVKKVKFSGS